MSDGTQVCNDVRPTTLTFEATRDMTGNGADDSFVVDDLTNHSGQHTTLNLKTGGNFNVLGWNNFRNWPFKEGI